MPKENLERGDQFDLVRALAPQTKMRKLLEIFDLGPDKDKNVRKNIQETVDLLYSLGRAPTDLGM